MHTNKKIKLAQTDDEIQNCYPVMAQLRPHIPANEFLARVKRQMTQSNFKLVYLYEEEIKAVAGIRTAEWLASGKYLEIEDLATKEGERSQGYGSALFDWIVEYAGRENCVQIKLVSHVNRFGAHRFYLNKRMIIEAHYFSLSLK